MVQYLCPSTSHLELVSHKCQSTGVGSFLVYKSVAEKEFPPPPLFLTNISTSRSIPDIVFCSPHVHSQASSARRNHIEHSEFLSCSTRGCQYSSKFLIPLQGPPALRLTITANIDPPRRIDRVSHRSPLLEHIPFTLNSPWRSHAPQVSLSCC